MDKDRQMADGARRSVAGMPAQCQCKADPDETDERERAGQAWRSRREGEERDEQRQGRHDRRQTVGGLKSGLPDCHMRDLAQWQIERIEPLQTDRERNRNQPCYKRGHDQWLGGRRQW